MASRSQSTSLWQSKSICWPCSCFSKTGSSFCVRSWASGGRRNRTRVGEKTRVKDAEYWRVGSNRRLQARLQNGVPRWSGLRLRGESTGGSSKSGPAGCWMRSINTTLMFVPLGVGRGPPIATWLVNCPTLGCPRRRFPFPKPCTQPPYPYCSAFLESR